MKPEEFQIFNDEMFKNTLQTHCNGGFPIIGATGDFARLMTRSQDNQLKIMFEEDREDYEHPKFIIYYVDSLGHFFESDWVEEKEFSSLYDMNDWFEENYYEMFKPFGLDPSRLMTKEEIEEWNRKVEEMFKHTTIISPFGIFKPEEN